MKTKTKTKAKAKAKTSHHFAFRSFVPVGYRVKLKGRKGKAEIFK